MSNKPIARYEVREDGFIYSSKHGAWVAYSDHRLIIESMLVELDAALADANRYRWLCDGHGYFMEEEMLCGHSNEKSLADAAIDEAIKGT